MEGCSTDKDIAAPLLHVNNVSRIYQKVIVALNDVNLIIDRGEKVALLGPSGSGKSTLLSLIAGYDAPTRGCISLSGRNVADWPPVELLTHQIGFLFQQFFLLDNLTAVQNIELALFPTCSILRKRRELSLMLLERVALKHRAHSRVLDLSGGERQRIAFCRSIINSPVLLLADEPTGNLDTASKKLLLDLLCEYNEKYNCTLLLTTHDPDVADICNRVIHLQDGKVVKA